MITIRHGIESDWLTLRVNGHSGVKGTSIACAAVSALVETLALYTLHNDGQADMGDGYANIAIRANRESRVAHKLICDGIDAVAHQFPGDVRVI